MYSFNNLNQTHHIRSLVFVNSLDGEHTIRIVHHLRLCRELANAAPGQVRDGDAVEVIGINADFHRLGRTVENPPPSVGRHTQPQHIA